VLEAGAERYRQSRESGLVRAILAVSIMPRAAKRFLFLIPPFTPAACWCARTIVQSMACSSSAGGPREASVSNAASHIASLLPREKRTVAISFGHIAQRAAAVNASSCNCSAIKSHEGTSNGMFAAAS
jgi:hypothetical protein